MFCIYSDYLDLWFISDEEGDESIEPENKKKKIEYVEDVHTPNRPILERQFFEAIPRAASIYYENDHRCKSLSEKLDLFFNEKLIPNAGIHSCKSPDDEVIDCLIN